MLMLTVAGARADGCPKATDDIATDRPDVTNSSLVVPVGSLQDENGANFSMRGDGRSIDGTNSRLRLGVAPCLEVLVDLPTYFANIQGGGNSGFSDVAPAIKWQISPLPGAFELSVATGVALPTGAVAIAGHGAQPYLQLPWSSELRDGWGISGMFTNLPTNSPLKRPSCSNASSPSAPFSLSNMSAITTSMANLAISSIRAAAIASHPPSRSISHVGSGLNENAPAYIFGIGYSFRLDGLF